MKSVKKELFEKVLESLKKEIEERKKHIESLEEAIRKAPSRNESRYDSMREEYEYEKLAYERKVSELESIYSYLKEMEKKIVEEKKEIDNFSFVKLRSKKDEKKLFILPSLGGKKIEDILIMSPSAPLFKAIRGKTEGDKIEMLGKKYLIVEVR